MLKFYQSRFGSFLKTHFFDLFTRPSQKLFLLLAFGFVLSPTRHTVANYIWRAGATAFGHFTRFYVFLGGPLFAQLDWLFITVIQLAERYVPADEPLRVRFDETTCKKTGETIEPADNYRNGCGTARQEIGYLMRYPRTLYGVNFVLGEMLIRLRPWPSAFVSVPIGVAVYVKKAKANELARPYRRRSELAREMLDRLCGAISPGRGVLSVQDGNYATRYFLRDLLEAADVMDLRRYRSWYRQKHSPSLFDIHWGVREHLYGAGIYPKVGFWETMDELRGRSSGAMPMAA